MPRVVRGNGYLVAGLAAGVAEACWAQGKWDEAEHFSLYSLDQEEVFFRAAACVALAAVRTQQQRHAEAAQLFAAAVEHAQQISDRATEAYTGANGAAWPCTPETANRQAPRWRTRRRSIPTWD